MSSVLIAQPPSRETLAEQVKTNTRQIDINTGRIAALEIHGSVAAQQNTEQIKELSQRITELEHQVYIWKGVVFGYGTVISLIEILQALGFVRHKLGGRPS